MVLLGLGGGSDSGSPAASTPATAPYLRSCGCAHRFMPGEGSRTTVRDRRRSRSRTPSNSVPRSRTPSSVSSGRTTPTSGPQFRMIARTMSEEILSTSPEVSRAVCVPHSPHRYQTTCWLEPRPVPIHYSSTVYMRLGSTKKRYVEEVTFQTRLVPRRFSESIVTATAIPSRHYTAILEIQCLAPTVHIINLEELQGINGMEEEHDA